MACASFTIHYFVLLYIQASWPIWLNNSDVLGRFRLPQCRAVAEISLTKRLRIWSTKLLAYDIQFRSDGEGRNRVEDHNLWEKLWRFAKTDTSLGWTILGEHFGTDKWKCRIWWKNVCKNLVLEQKKILFEIQESTITK